MSNPVSVGLWAIGGIAVVIGLLGLAGVAAISTFGSGIGPVSSQLVIPTASFSYSANNKVVNVDITNVAPTPVVSISSWFTEFSWGDGTIASVTTASNQHIYASGGPETLTDLLCENANSLAANPTVQSCISVSTVVLVPSSEITTPATGSITSTSPNGNAKIVPSFSVNVSGLSVSVRDTSVASNETIKNVSFGFGDGTASVLVPSGGNSTHLYAAKGSYSITEIVTGSALSIGASGSNTTFVPPTYTLTSNVTVAPSVVQKTSVGFATASSSVVGGLTATVVGIFFFGILTIVAGFVAMVRIDIAGVLVAVGIVGAVVVVVLGV